MSPADLPLSCPCGSQQLFANCCQPLLNEQAHALTAQALMRSRYSAFATGNIEYLIATLHPARRQADDTAVLAKTMAGCQWLALQVITCSQGEAEDESGMVEFIASYREQGQTGRLHERANFVREHNRWYYVDGSLFADAVTDGDAAKRKRGRNDPCWCGSGKKYKKCHAPH